VRSVRETLESLNGVEGVTVDFDAKTAMVTMAPGKSLSRDACQDAFRGSRYSVSAVKKTTGPAKPGAGI
jgi:copper chaperone CopZ